MIVGRDARTHHCRSALRMALPNGPSNWLSYLAPPFDSSAVRALHVVSAAWRQCSPSLKDFEMKSPAKSHLFAIAALVLFAAVSFSALAGWSLTPTEVIPSGAPDPAPLLLIALALTTAGLFLHGRQSKSG